MPARRLVYGFTAAAPSSGTAAQAPARSAPLSPKGARRYDGGSCLRPRSQRVKMAAG